MTAQFKQGIVIFRRWDTKDGLNESARSFQSMDELFNLCLPSDKRLLVDRVVLKGQDSHGTARTVTLVFQSASIKLNPTDK